MAQQDQLTNVVNAFEQWRNSKISRSARTPMELRQQAVALLSHYSKGKIICALKISGSNFKRWTQSLTSEDDSPSFVALEPVSLSQPSELKLTLDFANGCQLSLSGDISAELLTALTSQVAS